MKPHTKKLVRKITDDDVKRLLEIPIRRISRYDIEKNRKDIADILDKIKTCQAKLRNLTKTAIAYLKDLYERFGKAWPRKTSIGTFDAVDKRAVATSNLRCVYNPDNKFYGTDVRGSKFALSVSEYDKILLVTQEGVFRVVSPPDKLFLGKRLIHAAIFDEEEGHVFTVLYRDAKKMAYAKKIHIQRYTRGREYELIKGRKGRVDHLIEGDCDQGVHITHVAVPRLRVKTAEFDLSELDFCGVTAKGSRMSSRAAAKVKLVK